MFADEPIHGLAYTLTHHKKETMRDGVFIHNIDKNHEIYIYDKMI